MHQYFSSKITRYLPEFVYGSIDGTVTTFAIISGIAGAHLGSGIVIILGFSNVLADGFSMASSNYLSEQSHQEQLREAGEGEITNPTKTALATFLSFSFVGTVPLIAYLIGLFAPSIRGVEFPVASVLTIITFIIIGMIRGKVTGKSMWKSALQTCCFGVIAALVAYGVGAFLGKIV